MGPRRAAGLGQRGRLPCGLHHLEVIVAQSPTDVTHPGQGGALNQGCCISTLSPAAGRRGRDGAGSHVLRHRSASAKVRRAAGPGCRALRRSPSSSAPAGLRGLGPMRVGGRGRQGAVRGGRQRQAHPGACGAARAGLGGPTSPPLFSIAFTLENRFVQSAPFCKT